MNEFLHSLDLLILISLFGLGILAFIVSTVSGGGGSLILVPVLNWLIGVGNTAPVLNFGTSLGRPSRLVIFWKDIEWKFFWYYVPAALAGSWAGAWLFDQLNLSWLQIIVGAFLISTIFQFRFGKKKRSFHVAPWHFIFLGIGISVFGTIVGALGPVLNPFYLNAGLDKEKLIATKTANSFFMGLSQIGSYTFFGLLHGELWVYGISLGLGATLGNVIGKRFLEKMKSETFRLLVVLLMVVSGVLLIYEQVKELFSFHP